jgi:hypothetical protein
MLRGGIGFFGSLALPNYFEDDDETAQRPTANRKL